MAAFAGTPGIPVRARPAVKEAAAGTGGRRSVTGRARNVELLDALEAGEDVGRERAGRIHERARAAAGHIAADPGRDRAGIAGEINAERVGAAAAALREGRAPGDLEATELQQV